MAVVPAYAKASMQTTLLAIRSTELFVRQNQITNENGVELGKLPSPWPNSHNAVNSICSKMFVHTLRQSQ
jgi:hypothetical protein